MSQPKAAANEPKEIAGRYQIVSKLGAGAFGTVYKAKDKLLGRMLAIKTIRLEGLAAAGASLDELVDRFKREAQVSAQLKHPNIVTIYDIGESEGVSYLAMEFIDGQGLDRIIATGGRLPLERAANMGIQIAEALDFAHRHNVVHRDIKPANIMVEAGDRVKVTDFGIAKVTDSGDHLTMTGSLLGTPSYMSPEQARGGALDGRSDLFPVGCILYEMLAGRKAFRGDSITGLIFKIITEEPPSLHEIDADVPHEMMRIIAKALAKTPEARYQSGREIADDLQQFMRAGSSPTLRQSETPTAAGMHAPGPAPGTLNVSPTVQGPGPTVVAAAPTRVAASARPPGPPPPPMPMPGPAHAGAIPHGAPHGGPRPAPKSSAGLMIGLVVGGLFLALAAGGVGWMLLRKPAPPATTAAGSLSGGAGSKKGAVAPAGGGVTSPAESTGVAPSVPDVGVASPEATNNGPLAEPTRPPVVAGRPPVEAPAPAPAITEAVRGGGIAAGTPERVARAAPPASAEYAFLDEEAAPIEGREAGERLADAYRNRQGGSSGGSYGASGRLRARERSPRDLTQHERPAVATLRHVMNAQEFFQRKEGRYGSLADLSRTGFRLDVPVAGNAFDRKGYRFEVTVEPDGFRIVAMPSAPGHRPFLGDDTGFIRSGTE